MTINIKVTPGAKKDRIEEMEGGYKVYLTAPPVEGKANKALVRFLAKHFGLRRSAILIIKGLRSRNKVISIKDI